MLWPFLSEKWGSYAAGGVDNKHLPSYELYIIIHGILLFEFHRYVRDE